MADLFVSYRYWNKRDREYRFTYTVIAENNLPPGGVTGLIAINAITELLMQMLRVTDLTILYWRRMEEA